MKRNNTGKRKIRPLENKSSYESIFGFYIFSGLCSNNINEIDRNELEKIIVLVFNNNKNDDLFDQYLIINRGIEVLDVTLTAIQSDFNDNNLINIKYYNIEIANIIKDTLLSDINDMVICKTKPLLDEVIDIYTKNTKKNKYKNFIKTI